MGGSSAQCWPRDMQDMRHLVGEVPYTVSSDSSLVDEARVNVEEDGIILKMNAVICGSHGLYADMIIGVKLSPCSTCSFGAPQLSPARLGPDMGAAQGLLDISGQVNNIR